MGLDRTRLTSGPMGTKIATMGQQVFVGRSWERQHLQEQIQTLETRRGGRIVITGPPGMGKRSLVDWLLAQVPPSYLWARADTRVRETLPEQWLHGLQVQLGAGARRWVPQPSSKSPEFEEKIRALSRQAPVVLAAEGPLSPPRARQLAQWAERLRGYPILWVVATPVLPESLRWWSHLPLRPLRFQDLHRWLYERTRTSQTPEFLAWLWKLSGGIPAQIQALLDLLEWQGQTLEPGIVLDPRGVDLSLLLQRERERWQLLPPSLQRLLQALSLVPSAPREALQAFPEAETQVHRLFQEGFLVEDRGQVRVASGLLRQTLKESLSSEEQQELLRLLGIPSEPEEETHGFLPLVQEVESHLRNGRIQQAERVVDQAPLAEPERRFLQARILVAQAQVDSAFQTLLEVYREAPEGSCLRARASMAISHLCFSMGNLAQSHHFLEEALFHAQACGDRETLILTQSLQSALHGTEGNLQEAEEAWWNALAHLAPESSRVPLDHLNLLFFRGQYLVQYQALKQLRPRNREEWALNRLNMAETLLEMGQREQAHLYLEEGWAEAQGYPLWQPVGERLWAQWWALEGQVDRALAWVDRAILHYSGMKALIGLAKSFALRAEIRFRQGTPLGTEDLELALSQASQRRYLIMTPYLLERGLRGLAWMKRPPRGLMESLLARYRQAIQQFQATDRVSWFLKTLPAESPLRRRLTSLLHPGSTSGTRIQIKTLGTFRVVFPNLEVLVHTGSVKAKQLLATLALAPVQRWTTTAHFLAQALWPDLPPDRQIHNLHWTFSHLRKLLGKHAFLRQNDQYLLNPQHLEVDLWHFLHELQQAEAEDQRGAHALAVGKYQQALSLVEGPPFYDVEYPLLESAVRHLRYRVLQAFARVARFYLESFRPEQALLIASQGLQVDPEDPELQHLLQLAHGPHA